VNDEAVRLSTVGQVFRRRWRLLIVFAMVGAIAGAGASLVLSPGYETSAAVLLEGTRQSDELKTEAEVATSSTVLDRSADALRWGVTGPELGKQVSAAVSDGNVIAVTAHADTPEKAQQLADRVAHEYVAFSTQLASATADASANLQQEQQDALRDQIKATSNFITQLHNRANGPGVESVQVRTQLEAVRSSLTEAMTALTESQNAVSRTNIVVMGPAEKPTAPASPTLLQLAVGGALLAVLIGVFAHLMRARSDRRLYADGDIGSALGTSVLGSITVPADDHADKRSGSRLPALARGLLRLDQPWLIEQQPVTETERDQTARYQRVAGRLRDAAGQPVRPLVVLTDDDSDALAGVARLATEIAAGGEATEVVTDDPAFAEAVEALDASGPRPMVRATTDPRPPGGRTVLRLAELSPARPDVPEVADTSGVVLVTTAGTRTAWELVGLTNACVDAGHRVLGTVIVHRSRTTARPAKPQTPQVPATTDAMAGAR
jgi:capsular polysaccharide biosynthesis protein